MKRISLSFFVVLCISLGFSDIAMAATTITQIQRPSQQAMKQRLAQLEMTKKMNQDAAQKNAAEIAANQQVTEQTIARSSN